MDGTTPPQELFWCTYGTTTNAEIEAAINDGKLPIVIVSGRRMPLTYRIGGKIHYFGCVHGSGTVTCYLSTCTDNSWTNFTGELAPINSPTFTGTPKAPTATVGDSSKQIATTAFVQTAVGTTETVSGSTPTITGVTNKRYVCGEVSTISITPPNSGIIDVIFESGSTPTVLTIPNTVKFPSWFDATALEANTTYEINIMDGVYAAVMTW